MTTAPSKTAIEAWSRFIRVEHHLLDKVEADLKAAGLPPLVWYDVLLELVRVPGGRLRHRDLHGQMLLTKYNLSRLIDRMSEHGLVARAPVDDDARGAYIGITEAGRRLQKRIWSVYRRAIAEHFSNRLHANDLLQLANIMAKLI